MAEKLVLVTSSFPISGDGSEAAGSFVSDLVEELAKYIDVCIVAPGPDAVREPWMEQVEVIRYIAPPRPLSTLKPWRPSDLRWITRVWRGGLSATQAAARDGAASHILGLWGLPCGEWARRAARQCGIGYSVWLLGSDVWSLGRIPILRGRLARVIREATHAYSDGYQLAEDAKKIAGVAVEFLPSTRRIDLIEAPPPRKRAPYRLLFLGRWHPNKGIDLLLEALAMLDNEDWQRIECVEIHGGGPLDAMVRERVGALRSSGHPVEAGHFLTKREAEAAIARADWLLIPSRIESIPVVFSDAMKLGRPVIATPVGDLPSLIGNRRGFLCGAVTSSCIAEALRAVLHDGVEYDRDAICACADVFSLPTIAARLLSDTFGVGTDV